ncbi:hypothetical protein [Methylogaea oryzae]|nr:hypothetical protein [Methylogaea oryzae]
MVKPRTGQREEYWLKLQPKSSAAVSNQLRAWQTEHPESAARDNACP